MRKKKDRYMLLAFNSSGLEPVIEWSATVEEAMKKYLLNRRDGRYSPDQLLANIFDCNTKNIDWWFIGDEYMDWDVFVERQIERGKQERLIK